MTRRHDLEQAVIEAAEICVDSGGTKFMQLVTAVRQLRKHEIEMPSGAPVSGDHPVTSKLAARWMETEHPDLCAKVFREIWKHYNHCAACGLTTDEVQQGLNASHQSISPRITQLRNEGWVRDSGAKRKTRSGRSAIVWTPTQAAIDAMNGGNNGRLW